MSVDNLNQTLSYGASFTSDGAAHTFTLPFAPDYIRVSNYTKFGTVTENIAAEWYSGMPAGDGLILVNIADDGTTSDQNGVLETTNGFTDASTAAGFTAQQKTITGATAADPVVVTSAAHGFSDGDRVRITKVVGMSELNNIRYKINNVTTNTFELQDENGNDIDGSNFTAYSSGGQVVKVGPDLDVENAAEVVQFTFGSAVAGNDSDVLYFQALKFNTYEALGDIA